MNSGWNPVVYDVTDKNLSDMQLLQKLVTGDYPVVVLRGLLEKEKLSDGLARIQELYENAKVTPYVNGSLTLIGTFLVKYLNNIDQYFAAAKEADARAASAGLDLASYVREQVAYRPRTEQFRSGVGAGWTTVCEFQCPDLQEFNRHASAQRQHHA
jgi:hypothetical protein